MREAGSYLRLIDSCITQLKAQGPSRTCNESKEEEGWGVQESGRDARAHVRLVDVVAPHPWFRVSI